MIQHEIWLPEFRQSFINYLDNILSQELVPEILGFILDYLHVFTVSCPVLAYARSKSLCHEPWDIAVLLYCNPITFQYPFVVKMGVFFVDDLRGTHELRFEVSGFRKSEFNTKAQIDTRRQYVNQLLQSHKLTEIQRQLSVLYGKTTCYDQMQNLLSHRKPFIEGCPALNWFTELVRSKQINKD